MEGLVKTLLAEKQLQQEADRPEGGVLPRVPLKEGTGAVTVRGRQTNIAPQLAPPVLKGDHRHTRPRDVLDALGPALGAKPSRQVFEREAAAGCHDTVTELSSRPIDICCPRFKPQIGTRRQIHVATPG